MKSPIRLAAAFFAVAVAASVVAVGGSAKTRVSAGGTLRVGWEQSFGFTDSFDPTGEYLGDAFGIYSSLLVRTLVGYNHVPDAAGNQLVPDIATSVPAPTNGGTVYTFHLKPGIDAACRRSATRDRDSSISARPKWPTFAERADGASIGVSSTGTFSANENPWPS